MIALRLRSPTCLLLAVILLTTNLLPVSSAHGDSAEQCPSSWFYILATEWPQSFCRNYNSRGDCNIPASTTGWTLHGLWLNGMAEQHINYCTGPAYSEDDMGDLQSELQSDWPDFLDGENSDRLWAHEWEKYGVCALACDSEIKSQREYFALGISLLRRLDVGEALSAASIDPDDDKMLSSQSIVSALKDAYAGQPALACYNHDDDGPSYLAGIGICLDSSSHDVIDCPTDLIDRYRRCPAELIYPATVGQ